VFALPVYYVYKVPDSSVVKNPVVKISRYPRAKQAKHYVHNFMVFVRKENHRQNYYKTNYRHSGKNPPLSVSYSKSSARVFHHNKIKKSVYNGIAVKRFFLQPFKYKGFTG
jgi:hypothetical protein